MKIILLLFMCVLISCFRDKSPSSSPSAFPPNPALQAVPAPHKEAIPDKEALAWCTQLVEMINLHLQQTKILGANNRSLGLWCSQGQLKVRKAMIFSLEDIIHIMPAQEDINDQKCSEVARASLKVMYNYNQEVQNTSVSPFVATDKRYQEERGCFDTAHEREKKWLKGLAFFIPARYKEQ